jgi:hypothetical protein
MQHNPTEWPSLKEFLLPFFPTIAESKQKRIKKQKIVRSRTYLNSCYLFLNLVIPSGSALGFGLGFGFGFGVRL